MLLGFDYLWANLDMVLVCPLIVLVELGESLTTLLFQESHTCQDLVVMNSQKVLSLAAVNFLTNLAFQVSPFESRRTAYFLTGLLRYLN